MKKVFTLLVLSFLTFGCSKFINQTILKVVPITEYVLITTQPMPIYGPNGIMDTRYEDIPVGDTLFAYSEDLENTAPVIYKSTPIWTSGLYVKARIYKQRTFSPAESKLFRHRNVVAYNGRFKPYVDESYIAPAAHTSTPYRNTPTSGAAIHTGPRGGRYYINSNGNKSYIKK